MLCIFALQTETKTLASSLMKEFKKQLERALTTHTKPHLIAAAIALVQDQPELKQGLSREALRMAEQGRVEILRVAR